MQRLEMVHPIIQGPFGGGLSTAKLAATVSNLGGLGSFGAHQLQPDEIAPTADAIRALTPRPFALNLWESTFDAGGDQIDAGEFERVWQIFEPWYRELGLDRPEPPRQFHLDFEAQVEALLEARPAVFSFVFGVPRKPILDECRRRGIITVGAATSIAEAQALDAAGVDGIVASGFEAGGHRPSFLARAEDSLMGTFVLVPLIADRVRAAVIAAGGIADGRGVRAALTLGAQAAQVGTAFLACHESGASDHADPGIQWAPGPRIAQSLDRRNVGAKRRSAVSAAIVVHRTDAPCRDRTGSRRSGVTVERTDRP